MAVFRISDRHYKIFIVFFAFEESKTKSSLMIRIAFLFFFLLIPIMSPLTGQNPWDASSYPDEAGFRSRMEPMLKRIAAKDFGKRSLALSKCPDTGLPVYTWALEGEEIISPYSGTRYKQGPTGYFGPKSRNEKGQIVAFGGDPLKYDLPPATASMLLGERVNEAKAFLSIPGNLRQQYHFACNNWARFYPLLADRMSNEWRLEFAKYVGSYAESRRPSDGEREWLNLPRPHNLVGEPGQLLGGNSIDGGTENHKTQWRTSCLLYSQLLADTALISGYPVQEAEKLSKEMLRDYLKKLLLTGNGEYDSQVYYPYTIEGFLNLYDFSPDEETRTLAKFALDYYFVTYGLKVIDGAIAGAQKRGYLPGDNPSDMETMIWAFFNNTSRDMSKATARIHQVTTTYRPNIVIWNILRKNLKLPFEARMSRPFYHMDKADAFAESFYCSESYAMGNIQMTIVDNPNQQMVWSIAARGTNGPVCFSGGHPMRGSSSGHSPYTQTFQSKGSLIVLTGPTGSFTKADTLPPVTPPGQVRANYWLLSEADQGNSYEMNNRAKYASKTLKELSLPITSKPEDVDRLWAESKTGASTWFFFPRGLKPCEINGRIYFESGNLLLAIIPLTEKYYIVVSPDINSLKNNEAKGFFSQYGVIVFPGKISGYIVETAEMTRYGSIEEFDSFLKANTSLKFDQLKLRVEYFSANKERMMMTYNQLGLCCKASLNGVKQNFARFTEGAVYQSPYLNVKNGIMKVSDGKLTYTVDFTGQDPKYY